MIETITVENADVTDVSCDVLVLKYAQGFHGADALVASRVMSSADVRLFALPPGESSVVASEGKIKARHVLFIGVARLYEFGYREIREFAKLACQLVAAKLPGVAHVAMTMHGVGYGLDEREAFLAQLAGLRDAESDGHAAVELKRVTLAENNRGRAARLKEIAQEFIASAASFDPRADRGNLKQAPELDAGLKSETKPHIFVAMPFTPEMDDVYELGIQGVVNKAGYLCERVDMGIFTGDILARIKSRIETAKLVIADLTGANANVYLEVGYAWGKGRPALLLAKSLDDLKFDVKGQRCIVYGNILTLQKKLQAELGGLL